MSILLVSCIYAPGMNWRAPGPVVAETSGVRKASAIDSVSLGGFSGPARAVYHDQCGIERGKRVLELWASLDGINLTVPQSMEPAYKHFLRQRSST